ncbi:fatty acyl-AMP ligase [Streptomyces mangrovisoli]|uniref:fatty acyl-AMP ligase n=1 Tax=Streptomyces mangrovisoli TaxID=1428628 RepID=UPI000620E96F|nr:fatty acyl-AMP ligase [Streptomyces mangrovisoli]
MDSRRIPTPPRTLPEQVTHWARTHPERPAFTYADHPGPHARGVHRTLTWGRLEIRVRALAARLAAKAEPGSRVALLCPQGLDYVTAFLAVLAAGQVAVPLYPPGLPGQTERLAGILADASPQVVVTTLESLAEVRRFCAETMTADAVPADVGRIATAPVPATVPATGEPGTWDGRPAIVTADRVPDTAARNASAAPAPAEHAAAYLQYTSGSTRAPAGVEITHANVVANARQALTAYGADTAPVTCVGWLPLYHDMGLVLSVAAPVVRGLLSVLMDPAAFLQQPVRWLRLLGAYPRTVSAAPNFAYDYCAAAVTEVQKADLRLDQVAALINGSEPVRAATADRFHAAFAGRGLAAGTHCPSYGLAEATVFVSAARPGEPLRRFALDRDALAAGKALPARADDPGAALLTGCGTPAGQRVRIADPATGAALPEGEVGEIQVQGPNVGRGYFGRDGLTAKVFGGAPDGAGPDDDGPDGGGPDGDGPDGGGPDGGGPDGAGPDGGGPDGGARRPAPASARRRPAPASAGRGRWLRTGDLGTVLEGQLLVTGRLKDLIIVDGRNHYPQDVEATVQEAHPAVRRDRLAAFALPADREDGARPGGAGERTVVVAEHTRATSLAELDLPDLVRAVRAAVSARHGLRLADVVLVPPGTVPRTSSGKVSRALTRARYLEGAYRHAGPGADAGADAAAGETP